MTMTEILFKDEVFAVIGAAMAVHTELGRGFLEAVYHEALELELRLRQIPFQSNVPLSITYRGHVLQKRYEADMIAFNKIIIELKALDQLHDREIAQVLNYLKATGLRVGLLINFGSHTKLEWKRLVK